MKENEKSLSITLDKGRTKGCIDHNARITVAENVDPARSYLNKNLVAIPLKDAYKTLFEEKILEYFERTKNAKYLNYLEYMSTENRKPSREIIVQIGNMHDTPADSSIGKRAAAILEDYFAGFMVRNPQLYVIGAYLHLDEATPHLHIDFIPWGEGYKNGLDRRFSFARALKMQGVPEGISGYSSTMIWIDSEKQALGESMERFGLEWVDHGTHDKHKNIHTYKREALSKEIADLEQQKKDLKEELGCLVRGDEGVRVAEKYRGELLNKLEHDPAYRLEEPSGIILSKNYMNKTVVPLFERLCALLKELVDRLVAAKALIARVTNEKTELEHTVRDLKRENNILMRQLDDEKQRSKDLSLLKVELGHGYINRILCEVKERKKGTRVKTHDYYDVLR